MAAFVAIVTGTSPAPPARPGSRPDPPPIEFALEADQLAIETLIAAGYDPNGLIRSLERMERRNPSNKEPIRKRIESARRTIAAEGSLPQLRASDDGELERIQMRLRPEVRE